MHTKLRIAGKNYVSFVAVGLATGLVVSLFRFCIVHLAHYMEALYTRASAQPALYLVLLAVMMAFAVLVYFALKREPLIGGSGIPQVMGYLEDRISMKWHRILFYKLFGGILTIGSGMTVGREGPSVQVGAAVGQGIGEWMSEDPKERKLHTVAGACSGIAVAFNTPISGLIFAYEELKLEFRAKHFILISLSVLFANYLSIQFFGMHPIIKYILPDYSLTTIDYLVIVAVGVIAGMSGVLFNALIVWGKKFFMRWNIPELGKLMFAFGITFALIVYNIELFGSGEHFIFLPTLGNASIWSIIGYYVLTLFLLILAFCSGVPGGIFFPMLVIGSLLGNIVGLILAELGIVPVQMVAILATIAMAAHFSAIVRSPLTGMLLVFEMTGAFTFMLPLVIVSVFSYWTAELLGSAPIYDSLLRLRLDQSASPASGLSDFE